MRNALSILLLSGLSISSAVAKASSAEPVSVYTTPANAVAVNDAVLPVQGRDLPMTGGSNVGTAQAVPQATVEAIPSPTAFQAGVVLMIALAFGRLVRKLRLT